MACGIYRVPNLVNNHCYIGQAVDIHHRWRYEHLPSLRKGIDESKILQEAWNTYGEEAFPQDPEILEICRRDDLDFMEWWHFMWYQPEYNCYYVPTRPPSFHELDPSTRESVREKRRIAGKNRSPDSFRKMWDAGHTPETIRKQIEAREGQRPPTFYELPPEVQEATREKHRQRRGVSKSVEGAQNIRDGILRIVYICSCGEEFNVARLRAFRRLAKTCLCGEEIES